MYRRIFALAQAHKIKKLYLPGISIAIFSCPIKEATQIAIHEAAAWLQSGSAHYLKEVEFVLFDEKTYGVYQQEYVAQAREKTQAGMQAEKPASKAPAPARTQEKVPASGWWQ